MGVQNHSKRKLPHQLDFCKIFNHPIFPFSSNFCFSNFIKLLKMYNQFYLFFCFSALIIISLLNVDLKILSKALADCIKKYLPFLISSNQTAYVEGRFTSEDGRPFLDILQVTDFLNLTGLVGICFCQSPFFNNCTKKNLALVKHLLSGYKFS